MHGEAGHEATPPICYVSPRSSQRPELRPGQGVMEGRLKPNATSKPPRGGGSDGSDGLKKRPIVTGELAACALEDGGGMRAGSV